eukprot:5274784-Prymnesium_polylepis.2
MHTRGEGQGQDAAVPGRVVARPGSAEHFVVESTDNGRRMCFQPAQALEKLAASWNKPYGPSAASKKKMLGLSWAHEWADVFVKRSDYVRNVRMVTREAKITMLRIFCPFHPPSWRDEIPMRLDNGEVWVFKPVQWLDDVANTWLGGRSAVALTDDEKKQMETLPWVLPWVERIRERRAKRKRVETDPTKII